MSAKDFSRLHPLEFDVVLKHSGPPRVMNVWMAAANHEELQEAIRNNRIITALPRDEVGEVGFHPKLDALYLIFRRRLPVPEGRIVLGISDVSSQEPILKHAKT